MTDLYRRAWAIGGTPLSMLLERAPY